MFRDEVVDCSCEFGFGDPAVAALHKRKGDLSVPPFDHALSNWPAVLRFHIVAQALDYDFRDVGDAEVARQDGHSLDKRSPLGLRQVQERGAA